MKRWLCGYAVVNSSFETLASFSDHVEEATQTPVLLIDSDTAKEV